MVPPFRTSSVTASKKPIGIRFALSLGDVDRKDRVRGGEVVFVECSLESGIKKTIVLSESPSAPWVEGVILGFDKRERRQWEKLKTGLDEIRRNGSLRPYVRVSMFKAQ